MSNVEPRRNTTMKTLFAMFLVTALAAGCAQQQAQQTSDTGSAPSTSAPGDHGQHIELAVTENGFEPARVEVAANQPVTLVVTRKTEKTCAKELVLKEYNINQPLPMNEAVEITFTPTQSGDLTYACGMDMIKGVIAVH
jgi:plastocyanin domain-containing protein